MPADWKNIETIERLVAAIIASNGGKVDNQAVARYMNETYDAIENRTRVYKKTAQALVKEAEDAGRMDMNMKKSGSTKKTTATPKKDSKFSPSLIIDSSHVLMKAQPVKSGRVTKRAPKTPSKLKRSNSDEDEDEDMGDAGTTAGAANEEVWLSTALNSEH
ncbi:unnamed protein product [Aureobasidium mustum]|uniref:Uncharacterized protein n=1 Tax=Aureobasidium mustum TaxID=2773714 RepID=A0A9N8PKM2_9PEZI|nr:unnamed protein product [Aureobasidium mustum]